MGSGASFDSGLTFLDNSSNEDRYFCHSCHRVFGLGSLLPQSNYCPHCESTFLEVLGSNDNNGNESQISSNSSQSINFGSGNTITAHRRHGQLSTEQSRRISNATAMLRLLESQLRDELDHLQLAFESPSTRLNSVKPKKLTKIMTSKMKNVKLNLEMVCSQPSCPICSDEFVLGTFVTRLPCSHFFHKPCVTPWLDMKQNCPICRADLTDDIPCTIELEKLNSIEELKEKLTDLEVEESELENKSKFELALLLNTKLNQSKEADELAQESNGTSDSNELIGSNGQTPFPRFVRIDPSSAIYQLFPTRPFPGSNQTATGGGHALMLTTTTTDASRPFPSVNPSLTTTNRNGIVVRSSDGLLNNSTIRSNMPTRGASLDLFNRTYDSDDDDLDDDNDTDQERRVNPSSVPDLLSDLNPMNAPNRFNTIGVQMNGPSGDTTESMNGGVDEDDTELLREWRTLLHEEETMTRRRIQDRVEAVAARQDLFDVAFRSNETHSNLNPTTNSIPLTNMMTPVTSSPDILRLESISSSSSAYLTTMPELQSLPRQNSLRLGSLRASNSAIFTPDSIAEVKDSPRSSSFMVPPIRTVQSTDEAGNNEMTLRMRSEDKTDYDSYVPLHHSPRFANMERRDSKQQSKDAMEDVPYSYSPRSGARGSNPAMAVSNQMITVAGFTVPLVTRTSSNFLEDDS